jgi:hypothetical protein
LPSLSLLVQRSQILAMLVVAIQMALIEQISGANPPALKFNLLLVIEGTREREIH